MLHPRVDKSRRKSHTQRETRAKPAERMKAGSRLSGGGGGGGAPWTQRNRGGSQEEQHRICTNRPDTITWGEEPAVRGVLCPQFIS